MYFASGYYSAVFFIGILPKLRAHNFHILQLNFCWILSRSSRLWFKWGLNLSKSYTFFCSWMDMTRAIRFCHKVLKKQRLTKPNSAWNCSTVALSFSWLNSRPPDPAELLSWGKNWIRMCSLALLINRWHCHPGKKVIPSCVQSRLNTTYTHKCIHSVFICLARKQQQLHLIT